MWLKMCVCVGGGGVRHSEGYWGTGKMHVIQGRGGMKTHFVCNRETKTLLGKKEHKNVSREAKIGNRHN